MTVLTELVHAVTEHDNDWTTFIATHPTASTSLTCNDWDRRGGSHYKDGVFTKK